jgi:hypothetical protein
MRCAVRSTEESMTRRSIVHCILVVGLSIAAGGGAGAASSVEACGADSVAAGTICLDRYEASAWRVPNATTTNAGLVTKIEQGRATVADLAAGGATQRGARGDDYAPCADSGQNCTNDIYAVSLPSVVPSAFVTWFQAHEACTNAGKRLPTNAEWQVGVNGSPDPGPDNGTTDCNSTRGAASLTGERNSCVSARGAFDMVGNLAEWVAEWMPLSSACPGWGRFSNDSMCLAGASTTVAGPGALVRGGGFLDGSANGPLTVFGTVAPTRSDDFVGFRCARNLPEPGRSAQLGVSVIALAALARVRRRSGS